MEHNIKKLEGQRQKCMEGLVKIVDGILTQFVQEELGNRLSQFGMKGLRDVLLPEIANYRPTKEEVKKEDVKK